DRKPRYTGPRLPGDKGPSARPEKPKNLTHNPFAALAAKVEATRSEAAPEPAAEAPAPEALPETPTPPPPVEAAPPAESAAPAEPQAPTGGDPTP
ncbi:MAG TPA: phosphohydrolase, partial [Anaeromyxobacteraceae bacterium]|nr:phosphohydrolase [Anaeromyxobacteraceae bacterium]